MPSLQSAGERAEHDRLAASFPENPYLSRLTARSAELGIAFAASPVAEQWLYHPVQRRIYVWEPDLAQQSLSYLVVILAHELGHAVDFDRNPERIPITRGLHFLDVPEEIEIAAFVEGYRILKELSIPVSLAEYELMIAPPLGARVRRRIERHHLCCLLSQPGAGVTGLPPARVAVS